MTTMTLQALHTLVMDDTYASSFQSMGQYRGALLRHFDSLALGLAAGGISQSIRAFEAPPAQQATTTPPLMTMLRDVHDTLASQSDSDIDHFEDDDEEREGAPVQYAARKVMEVMDMLKATPSALGTPEAPTAWMDPNAGCVMDAFLWQRDPSNPQYSVPVYMRAAQVDGRQGEETT